MQSDQIEQTGSPLKLQPFGNIKNLGAALIKFQGSCPSVARAKENKYDNFKYADLGTIIATIREPLSKSGLAYFQIPSRESVQTVIFHADSGEYLEAETPIILDKFKNGDVKDGPKDYGASMTYARKYALLSILGVGIEGDENDVDAHKREGRDDYKPTGNQGGNQRQTTTRQQTTRQQEERQQPQQETRRQAPATTREGEAAGTGKAGQEAARDQEKATGRTPAKPSKMQELSALYTTYMTTLVSAGHKGAGPLAFTQFKEFLKLKFGVLADPEVRQISKMMNEDLAKAVFEFVTPENPFPWMPEGFVIGAEAGIELNQEKEETGLALNEEGETK